VLGSKIVAIFATLHNYKILCHLLSIYREELGETRKQCMKMKIRMLEIETMQGAQNN
jgi:hypothetical protein